MKSAAGRSNNAAHDEPHNKLNRPVTHPNPSDRPADLDQSQPSDPLPLRPHWRSWHWLPLLLGLAMLFTGVWRLLGMEAGVKTVQTWVDEIPITVSQPATGTPGPVVVIAHGFAGSRQLMRSFTLNLARNGYLAVSFDFPGHGDHPGALGGSLGSPERLTSLLDALTRVTKYAESLPHQGGLALLGHSMAGDIMATYARAHPSVDAIVAVSPYLSEPIGADFSPDTLFVYGGYEPEMIHQQGQHAIEAVAGDAGVAATTYGALGQGGARRLVMVPGVEHIGVLFHPTSLSEALDWLDASFQRRNPDQPPSSAIVTAGNGLGFLYAGLCLLAWPLSLTLPPLASRPQGASLGWKTLLISGLIPAIMTPLLLAPLPNDFLPILIGDYLALHFLVYGLLTWLMLAVVGGLQGISGLVRFERLGSYWIVGLGLLVWLVYAVIDFGWPTDLFVASFFPPPLRLPTLAILLFSVLVYSTADSWLVHGHKAPRGGGIFTKFLFLASLTLAVVLNLDELFFLVIIVPAILLLFLVYGWLGFLSYRRTWQPLPGAVASALAFALAITATFPVVA